MVGIDQVQSDAKRWPSFDVVAYHANCTDGIAAVAVVSLAIADRGLQQPEFVPVQYGEPLPEPILRGGNRLLYVDFCPEREQIPVIQSAWQDWFVIDHHKHRDWLPVAYPNNALFDLNRSGAVLTHDWLFGRPALPADAPADHMDESLPLMLRFVQDRDLWRWALTDSREISAALHEEPKTVERWRKLIHANPFDFLSDGKCLLKSRARAAQSLAVKAFLTQTLAGLPFRAVNATENMSEVGEEILRLFPDVDVACAFFQIGTDFMQLSFRSRAHKPGRDTALVAARELGGGGHDHAAGARIPLDDWPHFLRREGRGQGGPENPDVSSRPATLATVRNG